MEIPGKIYIHEASAEQLAEPHKDYHLEYISKDVLLEWLRKEETQQRLYTSDFARGAAYAFAVVIAGVKNL